jgi:hypothetical protein
MKEIWQNGVKIEFPGHCSMLRVKHFLVERVKITFVVMLKLISYRPAMTVVLYSDCKVWLRLMA